MIPIKSTNRQISPSKARSMEATEANTSSNETPATKMAKLEVESKKKRRSKLASSKSLTQLVPRSLFFLKKIDQNEDHKPQQPTRQQKTTAAKLVTCRSFPTRTNITNEEYSIEENDLPASELEFDLTPEICERMDHLKAWPRPPSKANSLRAKLFGHQENNDQTKSKQTEPKTTKEATIEEGASENGLSVIFNPVKQRFLFMRGNRSVQPRCRSKQPFAKLTNELATPSPTKLYSPFGIETPDTVKGKVATKSKRKLDLSNIYTADDDNSIKKQMTPDHNSSNRTVQSMKQTAAKEFTNFVSPTGKFRETINYVEQSQRDIEAISKAIMTTRRSALNNNNNLI